MRIGIPRALHAFNHYPLWHRFLSELGAEIVLSPPTDRQILSAGVLLAPAETCLPLKAYLGHVAWLRDKCDSIMILRLRCVKQGRKLRFGCPKAICLPDLVRATVLGLPPILELLQDEQSASSRDSFLDFGRRLDPDHKGMLALERAIADQKTTDERLRSGMPLSAIWSSDLRDSAVCPASGPAPGNLRSALCTPASSASAVRIGVIGHPYLLFDSALSLDLPDKLSGLGATVLYPAMLPEGVSFPEPTRSREISWLYEQELLGAAWYFLNNKLVDGLLLVSSFACGTSAVINEVIAREMAHAGIAMMTILLDEHTAESGIMTRLEAFVEMVRHRCK